MALYLAPLQGYTNVFYRNALAVVTQSVDKFFTPFFEEGKKELTAPEFLPELDASLNKGINVVPQVATTSSEFLIQFVEQVLKLGYTEINFNMGCPFPMLVKRRKGGGILAHPELVEQLLSDFYKADLPVKLSVKMRAGLINLDQGTALVKVLNHFPLEEVIIHPRLVTQKYSGSPDWEAFNKMKELCVHPVIGNGDIRSLADWELLNDAFPDVKGWMIGRGALSAPWLWDQIKLSEKEDEAFLLKILHRHFYDVVVAYYNDWYRSFNHLMSFWKYPLEGVGEGKRFYRKLKKNNTPESYQEWLKSVWELFCQL